MNHGEPGHGQIIIIKRGNSEEEGHHGGAWKIAFADFMTAMMALFLVLWLINAANEETKRAVASYFNPVKLVDRNRSSKGLDEQKGGPASNPGENSREKTETQTQAPPAQTASAKTDGGSGADSENQFFASPLEQLDAIVLAAQQSLTLPGAAAKPQPDSAAENFADPFGPDFWNQTKGGDQKTPPTESQRADARKQAKPEPEPEPDISAPDKEKIGAIETKPKSSENSRQDEDKLRSAAVDDGKSQLASDMKASIEEELKKTVPNAEPIARNVEIKTVEEGVLISVTDRLDMPMFRVGSAVPEAALVLAVDAIAKAVAAQTGPVHLFGHTDAREYKNAADGNWRLSTDRAKATYFMLLHGGLAESRIVEIAGFADRKLRKAEDPLADENRRIEILVETK